MLLMKAKNIIATLFMCSWTATTVRAQNFANITPAEARTIAKEAYIYGFSPVDNYRIMYAYYVDIHNKEFKASWNHLANVPRVFTPEDKAVQTPNSDTPYGWLGYDLRAEPIVITLPKIEKDRYFSLMFTDLFTYNFAYAGSRTTGNEGGSFLLAGPNWKGETPKGIKQVFRSETEIGLVVYRTQLFNPGDIENVKKIQAGYKVEPLSKFLGQATHPPPASVNFIKPLTAQDQRSSLEFYSILNFLLQFCPTDSSEVELMKRFALIGVGTGKTFDASKLLPEMQEAIKAGMSDALNEQAEFKRTEIDPGKKTPTDFFGTREYLKNNYLYRMSGTILGIYANSKDEAIYPIYLVDAEGGKLDGTQHYIIRFAPGQLPPVNAFWSMTMYELPSSLLTANPLNRYLLNSPMLPQMKRDADGGLTLYIQNESPGADKEANWLPAPKGQFWVPLRLYWPKEEVLNGTWKKPPMQRIK
jgi:hypothetical protein